MYENDDYSLISFPLHVTEYLFYEPFLWFISMMMRINDAFIANLHCRTHYGKEQCIVNAYLLLLTYYSCKYGKMYHFFTFSVLRNYKKKTELLSTYIPDM